MPSLFSRLAALLLATLTLGLGAAAFAPAPAHAAQHAITIKQYMFMPRSMSIQQGDTITWTNQDSVAHDVQVTNGPASFHSPMLAKGQSWSFTFTQPGSYSYICSVHPDMTASVTVAAAPVQQQPAAQAPPPAAAPPAGSSVAPAASSAPAHTHGTHPHAAASAPAVVPQAAPVAATPGTDASLDPLLLVGGVAVAVVVFCLLLLTSRPETPLLPARAESTAHAGAAGAHSADAEPTREVETV